MRQPSSASWVGLWSRSGRRS